MSCVGEVTLTLAFPHVTKLILRMLPERRFCPLNVEHLWLQAAWLMVILMGSVLMHRTGDTAFHGVSYLKPRASPVVCKELWGVRESRETVTSQDSLPGVLSLSKKWILVQGESGLSLVSCVGPDIRPGTRSPHLTREEITESVPVEKPSSSTHSTAERALVGHLGCQMFQTAGPHPKLLISTGLRSERQKGEFAT